MASVSLNASNRAVDGKGAARKVRKAGKLPGVIYHHGQQAAAVTVDAHELELVFHKTKNPNTLIEMHLDDGSKRLCLVREVQRHPVSQMMRHVDFYEVSADSPVDITVPLALVGRALGTRVGGTMTQLVRRVDMRCLPFKIPAAIEIDVTPLDIGDAFRVSQIVAPEGCSVQYPNDFNIVLVTGKQTAAAAPAKA